jgi:hypothetical protein
MVFRNVHQFGDAERPKHYCCDHASEKRDAELAEVEKVKRGALR